MPNIEGPSHLDTTRPAASLVTAELSQAMRHRVLALQDLYEDQVGHVHMSKLDEDDMYTTFAEVVVPQENESAADVRSRVEGVRERVVIAARQVIQTVGEPFVIPLVYDHIAVDQERVVLEASNAGELQSIRNLFKAVLWSDLDQPESNAPSLVPVTFTRPEYAERAKTFTDASVLRYFRPVNSPITSLQIREFSPRTRRAEIIDEFPIPRK